MYRMATPVSVEERWEQTVRGTRTSVTQHSESSSLSSLCVRTQNDSIFRMWTGTVHTAQQRRPDGSFTDKNCCSYNISKWPTWRTILLFYNTFITVLYMFRATSCSSSGGQILLIQHLVSSLSVSGLPVHRQRESSLSTCAPDGHLQRVTIPDAVLIQFDLLMMSTTFLETCRGL